MEARGMMPLKVIYLDVNDDIAMKRMKENDGITLV
jgi:thymidylate kinase